MFLSNVTNRNNTVLKMIEEFKHLDLQKLFLITGQGAEDKRLHKVQS